MTKFTLPKVSKRQMEAFLREDARDLAEHKRVVRWLRTEMQFFRELPPLEQFDVAARLVGDFQGADGYATLVYADGADHSLGEPACKFVGSGNHSCHFHLGRLGITDYLEFIPKRRWKEGRCFCAQGKTRDEAIRRALKLAGLL